mmetsp:Transcript_19792/g.55010  ORF Transcript_19792/g.55010 Transcript_19792/m.55010 type:complete len:202 (-) Transcript_19792:203-808(-)
MHDLQQFTEGNQGDVGQAERTDPAHASHMWQGSVWLEKKGLKMFGNMTKYWLCVKVSNCPTNPLFGCGQVITLNFYTTQSSMEKKGIPEILVIMDARQPCNRQEGLDKTGKYFIQVPVRGNMGAVPGLADGFLSFAVDSATIANTLLELFQQLSRTDDENGRPVQRSQSLGRMSSGSSWKSPTANRRRLSLANVITMVLSR